ncbi:hypothetical protein COB55_03700 [Candidatus Wolfebacteria bacterium]|nr:MAG: hypothetical protein COB55_03700 [Candidatus Wolfebacteria bacterium]
MKTKFLYIILLFCPLLGSSQSQGPNGSSTVISDGSGIIPWTNLGNSTLSNNDYVTCLNLDNNKKSDVLELTNFGFSIPVGSTINGIEVFIERHSIGDIKKEDVKLIIGGVINSTDHGNGNWPTIDVTLTYGNSTDTWKSPAPTVAEVNTSNFGIGIRIISNVNNNNLYIDSVSMKIYYSLPLPIDLLYFKGKIVNNKVHLIWVTVSESNNDYFTIEKSRWLTGKNTVFNVLDYINGAGNSNEMLYYSHIDDDPYNGLSYYKLKQTDYDGEYSYSKLISINYINTNKIDINVYPNPVHKENEIYLDIKGEKDSEVLVVVLDLLGNTRYSKIVILENGEFTLAIDPYDRLSSGLYLIVASSNDKLVNKKLIIE